MIYNELDEKNYLKESDCYFVDTMNLITGKWKPEILWFLLIKEETLRPGEMKRKIKGITQKMLTQQLRELERDGIIHRRAFAEVPPRVEYRISDYGKTLRPLVHIISEWGRNHLQNKHRKKGRNN